MPISVRIIADRIIIRTGTRIAIRTAVRTAVRRAVPRAVRPADRMGTTISVPRSVRAIPVATSNAVVVTSVATTPHSCTVLDIMNYRRPHRMRLRSTVRVIILVITVLIITLVYQLTYGIIILLRTFLARMLLIGILYLVILTMLYYQKLR